MTNNLTVITLHQPRLQDFSLARNQAMEKAKSDWILFVDSDETVPVALQRQINQAIKNPDYNYQLKRQDWFLGGKLRFGETSRIRLTRLIQKGTGQWQGRVHETFRSNLPLKILTVPLQHRRSLSLGQFLERLNRYTSLRAQELFESGKKFSLSQLLFWPGLKFIQNYFFRLGCLDGLPGLALAFFMSLHSLSVRVKLYELEKTQT
jgi:glycosyltransferase involved in cell wall biosynthesis